MLQLRVVDLQQHRRLAVGEAAALARLVEDSAHRAMVFGEFFRLFKRT